jgi:hypothetical protein
MGMQLSGSLELTGSFTTSGAIVAQTLVVQTITSSITQMTGSNVFGSTLTNTQRFTGSVLVTGSLAVTTTGTELQVGATGVTLGNALTDIHNVTGSLRVTGSGSHYILGGNVGIGTASPSQLFEVVGGEIKAGRVDSSQEGGQVSFGRALDNNTSWYIDLYGSSTSPQLRFVNVDNSVVAMTITGSTVGIGTSSPSARLDVVGSAGIRVNEDGAGTKVISIRSDFAGVDPAINVSTNNALLFQTNNTERMRITSGGKLCVGNITGTIFGSSANRIDGSVADGGQAVLEVSNSNTSNASPSINCLKQSATTNSDARFIQFYAGGGNTAMGGIVGNGANNAQFGTISDIREKENITPINGSLNKILTLNPVEFDWIKTKEHINAGFVAQEVETVFPEYVVENMSNDGEEERKGLTGGMSSGIIAHLVKAIQELEARVKELENK